MLKPGRTSKAGKKLADGELHAIADKLLSKITADDIRAIHAALLKRSGRQATYAMLVQCCILFGT